MRRAAVKNWFMLSVRISSYGCTREVWRARARLGKTDKISITRLQFKRRTSVASNEMHTF